MTRQLKYGALITLALFISFLGTFAAENASSGTATLLLKSDNGNVYKGADNKYYISSTQRIYVEAIDRSGSGKGVGVGRIDVKVDDADFIHYFKSKTDKIFFGSGGEHTITYRVTDRLGNMSNEQKVTIVIDDTKPTVKLDYKVTSESKRKLIKDNFIYLPAENSIVVSASDTISGLKKLLVARDSKDYEEIEPGVEFTLSKKGINLLKLKSVDNVSNMSSVLIYNFYVDTIAPTIEIKTKYALVDEEGSSPSSNSLDNSSPMGGDNKEVIEMKDPMLDAEPPRKRQKGKSEKSDGIERALPVEEIGLYAFEKDILPGYSKMSKKYTNTKNVFHFITYDNDSGLGKVEWKLNDGKWQVYNNEPVKLSESGVNNIEIRAVDLVGNLNTKSISIVVDDLAPEIKLRIASEGEDRE